MRRATIRGASASLPDFAQDAELTRLTSLAGADGKPDGFSRFSLDAVSMRAFDLRDAELREGVIRRVNAESAAFRHVAARSVKFSECNLGAFRWTGGDVSTVWFDNCKLIGARLSDMTLSNVVFNDCKLDYSTFHRLRTAGPVMFVRCSLREAAFDHCSFPRALFDSCELARADLGQGNYAGCDLRNNDLSWVTGVGNLKSAVIDRYQLTQLAEAMAAELNLTFGDDEGPPLGSVSPAPK